MLPKVSVIIPVYNTASYLRRCLDSVGGQTLRDIEILCINDASTDTSLETLREYEVKDERIKIIDLSENQGVSVARNMGMAEAQGEYLGFVDSDDVDPSFYEKLYSKAAETGAVIVKGERLQITEEGGLEPELLNALVKKDKLSFRHQFTTAIYKTTHIRKKSINFPPGETNSEDVAFLIKAVCLVLSVETVDGVFYRYHRRVDSSNSKLLNRAKMLSVLRSMEDVLAFINKNKVEAQVYDSIFLYFFQLIPWLLSRRDDDFADLESVLVQYALKLYSKCKQRKTLDTSLLTTRYSWHRFLPAGDLVGLEGYFKKNNTTIKLLTAELRARHIDQSKNCCGNKLYEASSLSNHTHTYHCKRFWT
jgi:glycosyltransferase involved in cell wall biosynthesis